MRRKRLEQIKTYSKIMKYKKTTGEVEQVCLSEQQPKQTEQIEEEDVVDVPKNEQFEDEFEDQFEKEEAWMSDSGEEEEVEGQSGTMVSEQPTKKESKQQVFLGTSKNVGKGQVLQFDNRAYDMLHRLNVEWPSLSIDFICKSSPFDSSPIQYQQMTKYPYQVYTVQGSSTNSMTNSIYFTKWHKLHRTRFDDDPDECQEENEQINEDQDPEIVIQQIQTTYDVNRIRSLNNSPIVAFWSDKGKLGGQIHIIDLSTNLQKLKNNIGTKKKEKCKEIIIPTQSTGFALNWNPHKIGQLLVGNDAGGVQVYTNNENYTSWSKSVEYTYHKSSVEDIVISPEQAFVFASCSSDRTLQIVDMRVGSTKKSQLKINAHQSDVNVCDWNKIATHLIVTGGDDCQVKVWDLRMSKEGLNEQLLCFNWHTQPITSIKFQPNQESVIAVASEDNRLSIWDMSVQNQQQDPQVPNELMFLHQGQQQIKQICFHPIYYQMLISSSLDSINIFKPCYEQPQLNEDEAADIQDLKKPPIKEEELDKFIERMSLQ